MDQPLVTISIPVYNRAHLLLETMQSVISQTYQNLEILCFDDCSTDDSLTVLREFAARDSRIKVVASSPNKGQSAMRNMGLDMAKGKYVAVLDSDDVCLPQRIERQVAFMEAHPEIGMGATHIEYIGERTRKADNDEPCEHALLKFRLLLCNCPFRHSSVIFRKSEFDKYAIRYDEDSIADDFELYTRIADRVRFTILPEVLVQYREHANSITSQKHEAQKANALDCAYRMACREFSLSDAGAEKLRFFYASGEIGAAALDDMAFVFTTFLAHPEFQPHRKEVLKRLLGAFYRIYRRNPRLIKQNFKPFVSVVKKYRTGYGLALKLYLKKVAK